MKLFYRGHSYSLQSNLVATCVTEVKAKYRGNSYFVTRTKNAPNSQTKNLVYRGVPYIKQPEIDLELTPIAV